MRHKKDRMIPKDLLCRAFSAQIIFQPQALGLTPQAIGCRAYSAQFIFHHTYEPFRLLSSFAFILSKMLHARQEIENISFISHKLLSTFKSSHVCCVEYKPLSSLPLRFKPFMPICFYPIWIIGSYFMH